MLFYSQFKLHFHSIEQVRGDNFTVSEGGGLEYELGCYLYVVAKVDEPNIFKLDSDWWLIDLSDIIRTIKPPEVIERRTCTRYKFDENDLDPKKDD